MTPPDAPPNPPEQDPGLAYRKKHFAVEVLPHRYPLEPGELTLSTTTNGRQWTSMPLLISEAKAVIGALDKAIPQPESPASGTPRTDLLWVKLMEACQKSGIAPANCEAFKSLIAVRASEQRLRGALEAVVNSPLILGELAHIRDFCKSKGVPDFYERAKAALAATPAEPAAETLKGGDAPCPEVKPTTTLGSNAAPSGPIPPEAAEPGNDWPTQPEGDGHP